MALVSILLKEDANIDTVEEKLHTLGFMTTDKYDIFNYIMGELDDDQISEAELIDEVLSIKKSRKEEEKRNSDDGK